MNKRSLRSRFALSATCLVLSMLVFSAAAIACTSILVTPGASVDGTASVTHTCDSGSSPHELIKVPAQDWAPGTMIDVYNIPQMTNGHRLDVYAGEPTGNKIPQVAHTYAYIKSGIFGIINEKQVGIGETTTSARSQSRNSQGYFDITNLSMLGLERAATARECVLVMGKLAEKYGYKDAGEQLAVADPNEVWLFEIVGPGPLWEHGDEGPGAYWVAQRVPDGQIAACANNNVIDQVIFNDTQNFLCSPGILDYAISQGWWTPNSGMTFSWRRDFCNARSFATSGRRVWGVYRLAAPKLAATLKEENLPFSIYPEKKLSISDINAMQRDHYEGTIYDGTTSLTAGPFGNPRRYRGLGFRVDGVSYSWNRMIAQVQCEYTITTVARKWLPNEIGGLVWYGAANPDATCYLPLYACMTELDPSLSTKAGSHQEFTRESYWWSICAVSTFIDQKYNRMIVDVNNAIDKYEGGALRNQAAIESAALELYKKDPKAAVAFLTKYSNDNAVTVRNAWWDLFDFLLWKYNIGFEINTDTMKVTGSGYPESWMRRVVATTDGDIRRP